MATDYKGYRIIASAIITAALIIVVVPIVHQQIQLRQAATALKQLTEAAEEDARKMRVALSRSSVPQPAAPRPIPLRANETCTSGYVVRAVSQPSKGWEQVIERGQPARCSGRYRVL